jgi:hypothetical protein
MLREMNYKFSADAREAFVRYISLRKTQPLFSNARSIRNALDRLRLRQASRLVADLDRVLTADDAMSLEPGTSGNPKGRPDPMSRSGHAGRPAGSR